MNEKEVDRRMLKLMGVRKLESNVMCRGSWQMMVIMSKTNWEAETHDATRK